MLQLVVVMIISCISVARAEESSSSGFCEEVTDETFGVRWPETEVEERADEDCPDSDGDVYRDCIPDSDAETGGRWGDVISDECEESEVAVVQVMAAEAVCPPEKDHTAGAHIFWPETPTASTLIRRCPSGQQIGNVSRACEEDSESPTGGTWAEVDVSECNNPVMRNFYDSALYTVNQRPGRAEEMIALMNDLQVIVNQASSNDTLYPSDLILGTDIMHRISLTVNGLRSIHRQIDVLAQTYGDSMSALTDNQTFGVWENRHERPTLMDTAATILQSMDNLAIGLLNTKFTPTIGERVEWTRLRINSTNLDFEVVSYPEEFNEIHELVLYGENEYTQIIFPVEVVNTTERHATAGIYGFYRGQFLTIQDIFNKELGEFSNGSHHQEVGTPIISARPLAVGQDLFSNLSEPVILIFRHREDASGRLQPHSGHCHFLNMSAHDNLHRWSKEGCEMFERNETHTICHCYHLTNFALLMDLFNMTLSKEHVIALTFISYVGGTLSVVGCALSIIIYEFFRLSGDCIRIHEMLAVSIILTQITFFVGFEIVHHQAACQALAVLLHVFLMSMFCWMLVEGVHLYVCLVKVFRRNSNFKKYCVIGWGIPVVIVAVSVMVFLDDYGGPTMCWVTTRVLWIAFVPFVLITILINLGVLITVLRVMHQSIRRAAKNRNEDIPMAKAGVKAIIVLMPLLGLTWSFGFLSVDAPGTIVFTYLFTIFNSLQGVFFFTFHCLLNNEVRRAFDRRYQGRRHSTSRTKSGQEPGKSPLTGGRLTDSTKQASDSPLNTRCRALSKKTSASSKSSVETNVTHFDDIVINDEELAMKYESILGEKRDAKLRKDLDNLMHKFDSQKQEGKHEYNPVLGIHHDNCTREKEIKDALAAFDSAILVDHDYETCCVTHM